MAVIFCDSSVADDSQDGSTWAKAKKTLQAAITAAGGGGTVYLADTHSETYSASTTLTLPTSNPPVLIISSDVLSGSSVSYKKPTAYQFQVTGSGNDLILDGAATCYGVWLQSNDKIACNTDNNEAQIFIDSTLDLSYGTGGLIEATASIPTVLIFINCTIILNDSGNTGDTLAIINNTASGLYIENLTVTHATTASRRKGYFISQNRGACTINGVDISALTGLTGFTNFGTSTNHILSFIDGIKLPNGATVYQASGITDIYPTGNIVTRYNGNSWDLYSKTYSGSTTAQSTITRDSGASIDGSRVAWTVDTTANCNLALPYYTPWINGTVSSTGNKTVTVYIGNATADLTDTEVWLEVDYMGTASSVVTKITTDQNADPLAAGTAQTDDTSSDWDTDLTYMQSLAVTVAVNTAGAIRARVVCVKPSTTFYVDPHLNIS